MTFDEFMEYCRSLDKQSEMTLLAANMEYATDENKFENFEGIADFMRRFNPRLSQITAVDVAMIYKLKHDISMMRGSIREPMQNRVLDSLNYTKLIGGMLYEAEKHKEGWLEKLIEDNKEWIKEMGDK
jgi:hypothetical protein